MTNSSGAQIGGRGYVICRRCKLEATDISVDTSHGYAFHVVCRPATLPAGDQWSPAASSMPHHAVITEEGFMTVAEAAKALGHKHTSRVYDLIKKRTIEAKQVDGVTTVNESSLKAYKEQRDTRASQEKKAPKRAVRAVPKPSKRAKSSEAA